MSPLDDLQDRELLDRFQTGESEAFSVLLHRYQKPLFNFIAYHIGRSDVAEDLLQDVFTRVIQGSADFKGDAKVSTWLYTIARNICIDHLRKMRLRRHRSLDGPAAGQQDAGAWVEHVASPEVGTDRRAASNRVARRLAEAVALLPFEQREVFLLRHLQQLQFAEIASITEVPENTVKSRMRYALERLQEALADYEEYARALG